MWRNSNKSPRSKFTYCQQIIGSRWKGELEHVFLESENVLLNCKQHIVILNSRTDIRCQNHKLSVAPTYPRAVFCALDKIILTRPIRWGRLANHLNRSCGQGFSHWGKDTAYVIIIRVILPYITYGWWIWYGTGRHNSRECQSPLSSLSFR